MQSDTAEASSLRDNEPPVRPEPPATWPPRIHAAKASRWMRDRDLLLTIAVWMAYIWILREPIVALLGLFAPRLGALLRESIQVEFTVNLWPYLWVAAALVAWLALYGVLRREYLSRQAGSEHDVPELPPTLQFEHAGVPVSQQPLWREARCLRVLHKEGRIIDATMTSSH